MAFAAPGRAPARCSRAGSKIFFGISDTGNSADFGHFSTALHKHPALIESFRTWGSDFPDSIQRWQAARARPVLHITTADTSDGHELITPRAIAEGDGDDYLVRLNKLFWAKKMRAYIRPLGEPNRCINVYASYDCEGNLRDAAHRPRLVPARLPPHLHPRSTAAASAAKIDDRLAEAGPAAAEPPKSRGLPQGAGRGDLEHAAGRLADRAPATGPSTSTRATSYVDWVGTDFYSDNQDWKSLNGLYNRFSSKPFAIPEFGVSSGDDPRYVEAPDGLGQAPPALQDARLLPGLRLLEPLPDPELPGEPRRPRRG